MIVIQYLGKSGAGPEFAIELAREYAKLYEEVILICSDKARDKMECLKEFYNINIIYISTYSNIRGLLAAIIKSPYFYFKKMHHIYRMANFIITPMSTPLDIVYKFFTIFSSDERFTIIHDSSRHPGDKYALLTYAFQYLEILISKRIIFLSKYVHDQCLKNHKNIISSKEIIIGFHPNFRYCNILPRTLDVDRTPVLLFLGRIVKYKGLEILIEALKILNDNSVPCRLIVAGSGDLNFGKLPSNVEVYNKYLDNNEIANCLRLADIMVLPYIEASQSGVASACYSASLPIVYNEIQSLREQLYETGSICTGGVDAMSLAKTIEFILNEADEYQKLSAKQFLQAEKLTWSRLAYLIMN